LEKKIIPKKKTVKEIKAQSADEEDEKVSFKTEEEKQQAEVEAMLDVEQR